MNIEYQHWLQPMALTGLTGSTVAPIGTIHSLVAHTKKCGGLLVEMEIVRKNPFISVG